MNNLLILPVSSVSLVFGLYWLPLISGRASRDAYRIARQHRATHLVVSGESAAAVGLAAFKPDRRERKSTFNSAAQNVARLHAAGTVALVLELEPHNYWLVAVHEGAVVARTDKLYRSRAEAVAVLEELRQAYPQLVVLDSSQAPESLTLETIAAASEVQTQLAPLGRWRSVLPLPIQCFLLALLLVVMAPRLWAVLRPATAVVPPAYAVDPVLAWQDAISQVLRSMAVHGVGGTQLLLNSIYQVPVRISGWDLADVLCTPEKFEWHCQARYDRRDPQASNEYLLSGVPASWTVEFESIERANAKWGFKGASLPVLSHKLKNTADNERYLFSALQSIKPAFTQMQVARPAAIKVQPPRDGQNQLIPKPAHIPAYLTRSILIEGPLRSASLLLPYTESIRWRKVHVTVRQLTQPGIKSSRLSVSFQGELYELEQTGNNQGKLDRAGITPTVILSTTDDPVRPEAQAAS
ncbi:MAG TPA: type 4b pilus protein PilO2 [Eoetvoesiella sp.]